MSDRASRSFLMLLIAGVVGLAAASCSSQPTAPSPGALASTAATEVKPGGPPTEGAELASIRAATSAFHDVDAAVAAGYAPPTAPCVASPAGTMGIHSPNLALMDQTIDPLRPEVLLFLPKPGGGVRLVGVEYFVPILVRSASGVVAPWFDLNNFWPSTSTPITQRPNLYGQPFDGPMLGHDPGMPAHYDLHVWVWQPNPNGVYAPWNPAISCGG